MDTPTIQKGLRNFLAALDKKFTSWEPQEFIEFLEANKDFTADFLPVSIRKRVIVPKGTQLDDCNIDFAHLCTMARSLGRPGRFKGIGPDICEPITPWAIALRANYQRVHIDIDAKVFGSDCELHPKLIGWVEKTEFAALKVRGSRNRLSLIFGLDVALKEHIDTTYGPKTDSDSERIIPGVSKLVYSLKDTEGAAVEVTIGKNNNTLFGHHPAAGQYQQVAPDDMEVGGLTLEEFTELLDILDEISVTAVSRGGAIGNRVTVDDVWEETRDIVDLIEWNDKLDVALATPASERGIHFDINQYLSANTVSLIQGELVHNGSSYIPSHTTIDPDADDDAFNYSIVEGVRHSSYRQTGLDINQIVTLFENLGIGYSEDDVEEIFYELWELTDKDGNGARDSGFTEGDARAAFYGSADATQFNRPLVTFDHRYLINLCAKIFSDVLDVVNPKVEKIESEDDPDGETEIAKEIERTATRGVENLSKSIESNNSDLSEESTEVPIDAYVKNPYELALGTSKRKKASTKKSKKKKKQKREEKTSASVDASQSDTTNDADTSAKDSDNTTRKQSRLERFARIVTPDPKALEMPDDYTDGDEDPASVADAKNKLKGFKEKVRRYGSGTIADDDVTNLVEIDDEQGLNLVAEKAQQEKDLKDRVTADNLSMINTVIREHLKQTLGHKFVGYTFPFLVQAMIQTVACYRNLEVINLDQNDNKYPTTVAPFGITAISSGSGKSVVSKLSSCVGDLFNTLYSNIDAKEIRKFKKAFMNGSNLIDSSKLEGGSDPSDSDEEIGYQVETLIELEQLFATTKVNEFLAAPSPRNVGDTTDAGLRGAFRYQQMRKDVAFITNDEYCEGAYSHPVAIYNDEIGSTLKSLYATSRGGGATYSGDTQLYCALKEGHMKVTARQTTGISMSDNTTVSFGGNMTTKSFLDIMRKEIEGTDGLFPRINFSIMSALPFQEIDTKRKQNWSKGLDSSDLIKHYMMGSALVTHFLSKGIVNYGSSDHPLTTGKIRLSEEAQEIMYEAMNRAEKEKKRMKRMFPTHAEFINSCLDKQPKEVALYSGALTIFDNAIEFYNELITHITTGKALPECDSMTFEQLVGLSLSKQKRDKQTYAKVIEEGMRAYGATIEKSAFGFDRQVGVEAINKAVCLFYRSIHTIEYFLYQLDKDSANNLNSRAKEARDRSTIRMYDAAGYNTEEQFEWLGKGLIKYISNNGDTCVFTEAKLAINSNRAVRKIYDDDKARLSKMMNVAVQAGILEKAKTRRADSKAYKLSPDVEVHQITDKCVAACKALISSAT